MNKKNYDLLEGVLDHPLTVKTRRVTWLSLTNVFIIIISLSSESLAYGSPSPSIAPAKLPLVSRSVRAIPGPDW